VTLKRRVIKLSDTYLNAVYGLINEYWEEAMDHNPEAAALWDEFDKLVEESPLKPPCMFRPNEDSYLRKRNWVMLKDERAGQIVNTLLRYVDSYVDSKGGIFAEPKSWKR
jgi:hypothetical protein